MEMESGARFLAFSISYRDLLNNHPAVKGRQTQLMSTELYISMDKQTHGDKLNFYIGTCSFNFDKHVLFYM